MVIRQKSKQYMEKLPRDLGVKIEPAPDEWDRVYNVDFYIEIDGK